LKRFALIALVAAACGGPVAVRTASPTIGISDDKLFWCARSPLTLINVASALGIEDVLTDPVFKDFAAIAVRGVPMDHDPSASLRANKDVVRLCTVAYETAQ
jgi:hypothetical protein